MKWKLWPSARLLPRKSNTATCTAQAAIITEDQRLYFPHTEQNRQAIWQILRPLVEENRGPILEVASGSGEHLAYFHRLSPDMEWQGSDPDPAHRDSIRAWNPGLPEALNLDTSQTVWPDVSNWGGLVAINLVHIAPWSATVGLFRGATERLPQGNWLYLYGAYLRRDQPNAPSNLAFDESLREQNPEWGVRYLDEMEKQGELWGFRLDSVVEMPANNFSLIFRRK